MITIRLKTKDEVSKAWSRKRRPAAERRPSRPLNLGAVLDLGDTVYFPFRGRAYGVPPLPWREGERLLDCYTALREQPQTLDHRHLPDYFTQMHKLARLIWRNVYPAGKIRRLRKRLGLLQNPFMDATERELADLARFLLTRRTSTHASSGQLTRTARTKLQSLPSET